MTRFHRLVFVQRPLSSLNGRTQPRIARWSRYREPFATLDPREQTSTSKDRLAIDGGGEGRRLRRTQRRLRSTNGAFDRYPHGITVDRPIHLVFLVRRSGSMQRLLLHPVT